jgi:putative peptidoglycan lipid II flippase
MSRLFRISVLLAFFFGLEKLLGFARQVLIARQFGLSSELDVFNAANNYPDLIFALISGGALAVAFIPVLSEHLQTGGRPAAWKLFSRIANLVFLITAGLSLVIALLALPLVRWNLGVAPGFSPGQQALVADLMRLNLVATLLFSLAGLAIAGLQANQHFFLPALAPSMYDIGMLFGVLVLAPENGYRLGPLVLPAFGLGVYGLVYGVIAGAALFLGVQIPGLIRYGFRWAPAVDLSSPGVRQVLRLLGPRVATMFFIQVVFLATDNLASRLATGSVSALTYGWLIMQVPETLIGTAIGTALLPTLAEHVARHEEREYAESLNRTLRVILALTLPATALLALVLRPIVGILNFEAADTERVVWTARALLLGLSGHSMLELASRAFYARQDARTPLKAAGFMVLLFILLAVLLARPLGAAGIGLANAIAFTSQAVLLLFLLNRRIPGLLRVDGLLLRVALVSLGGGLLVYALMQLPLPALPLAAASLAAGAAAVLPFIWPEVRMLLRL